MASSGSRPWFKEITNAAQVYGEKVQLGERARQCHQAALDGGRRAGQFIEEKTPPSVKQRLGEVADAAERCAQVIEDKTPSAVEEKLAQAGAAIDKIPAPIRNGMAGGALGAVILTPILAPAILGGIYGIAATGPVAGGVFAGIQASGAVVGGVGWATVQSIAMGGALPLIGAVGAGGIGSVVGAAGGGVACLVGRVKARRVGEGEGEGGDEKVSDASSKLTRDMALKFLRDEEFVEKSGLDGDRIVIRCTACGGETTVWTETEKDEGDLEPGLGAWIYHEERCDGIRVRAKL